MKKTVIREMFKDDYISRVAGEKLRLLIEAACQAGEKIDIDFAGVIVASTSFFDEGIAKLAESGWDKKRLEQFVTFTHLDPRDREVMEKMCRFRKMV